MKKNTGCGYCLSFLRIFRTIPIFPIIFPKSIILFVIVYLWMILHILKPSITTSATGHLHAFGDPGAMHYKSWCLFKLCYHSVIITVQQKCSEPNVTSDQM